MAAVVAPRVFEVPEGLLLPQRAAQLHKVGAIDEHAGPFPRRFAELRLHRVGAVVQIPSLQLNQPPLSVEDPVPVAGKFDQAAQARFAPLHARVIASSRRRALDIE